MTQRHDLQIYPIVLDWNATEAAHIYWLTDTEPNKSELTKLCHPTNTVVAHPETAVQAVEIGFTKVQIAVEPASGLDTSAADWEELATQWTPAVSVPAEHERNEELAALALAIRHGCRIIRARDVLGAMRVAQMMQAVLEVEQAT